MLLMQMDNVNFHLHSPLIYVSVYFCENDQQIVEGAEKQHHKIPLGVTFGDETAAVLCCNQRNEYTIPIVTLTCNHARQFRTTRTP